MVESINDNPHTVDFTTAQDENTLVSFCCEVEDEFDDLFGTSDDLNGKCGKVAKQSGASYIEAHEKMYVTSDVLAKCKSNRKQDDPT